MELVYLWVEDYKNIYKQGFNFSPRFDCKYENDELTIVDKEETGEAYLKNFFGDDINVTAIVGKNGSGKSSLIKLIFLLIFFKKYESFLTHNAKQGKSKLEMKIAEEIKRIRDAYKDKNLFLIILDSKGNLKKVSINTTTINIGEKPIESLEIINFFSIHFNYMIDTLYDSKDDYWIKSIYHKADSYETPLLLEPYKNNNYGQQINLDLIEYLNNQNMLRFFSELKNNKQVTTFFNPNKLKICLSKNHGDIVVQDKKSNEYEYQSEYNYKLINMFYKIRRRLTQVDKKRAYFITLAIEDLYKNNEYEKINILYMAFKILYSDKKLFIQGLYQKINKWFVEEISGENLIPQDLIKQDNLIDILADGISGYEVRKLKSSIGFHKEKKSDFILEQLDERVDINTLKKYLDKIPPWIDVEWFEDNKSIKSLSSGEKSFFTFIINLMYQVQNISDRLGEYDSINLFLDEVELGLHPQWQKEYLSNILKALEQINKKKTNIIFATHSPFLISDLPKENVMFLKDGRQDKGIKHKQTFGANIHTLLSDSFFMEDGLMGEFAKGKINKIIRFLNGKNIFIDFPIEYIEKVIESIGEPFLKSKLLDMYNKKFIADYNERKKKNIEKKIEDLNDELRKLND